MTTAASLTHSLTTEQGNHCLLPQSFFGVTSLSLRDFRNFEQFDHDIKSQSVLLVAPNGSGKTNILESLSLFSPGKGLRNASFKDMQRQQTQHFSSLEAPWQVGLSLSTHPQEGTEEKVYLGTTLKTDGGQDKRIIKHNALPLKQHNLLTEYLSVVWFTPTMGHLFLESGSTQRQFLDRLVFSKDPHHAKRRSSYDKVLRERNRILMDYGPTTHASWLDSLEETLASLSFDIIMARSMFLNELMIHQPACQTFPQFVCSMEGDAEKIVQNALTVEEGKENLQKELFNRRKSDSLRRGTSLGPHRGTFYVRHIGKNQQASLCSTGEQKMLVLALLLSTLRACSVNGERGAVRKNSGSKNAGILLLLDDVLDHLDTHHRHVFLKEIGHVMECYPLQVWISSANASDFSGIEAFFKNPQWISLE